MIWPPVEKQEENSDISETLARKKKKKKKNQTRLQEKIKWAGWWKEEKKS